MSSRLSPFPAPHVCSGISPIPALHLHLESTLRLVTAMSPEMTINDLLMIKVRLDEARIVVAQLVAQRECAAAVESIQHRPAESSSAVPNRRGRTPRQEERSISAHHSSDDDSARRRLAVRRARAFRAAPDPAQPGRAAEPGPVQPSRTTELVITTDEEGDE